MSRARIQASLLLAMATVTGLSMMAGMCNGRGDMYVFQNPTFTPAPTVPGVPPTEPAPTDLPTRTPMGLATPTAGALEHRTETPTSTKTETRETTTSEEAAAEAKLYSTEPRDLDGMLLFTYTSSGAAYDDFTQPTTVEELLEKGAYAAEASPVHIAFIGTPVDG